MTVVHNKKLEAVQLNLRLVTFCRVGDAGQRLVTVLGFLEAPESGGVTAFQHLRTTVLPKVGRLVVWHNCYDETATLHPDTVRVLITILLKQYKEYAHA